MIILAIESSCDDTCVAILKDKELLSNVVSSQTEFHNKYGGVMPELASRLHVEKISFVIKEALNKANVTLKDVDYIVAPIADNRMFEIIDQFIDGEITDIQCQHCLSATNLGNQYVFISEKALNQVEILERCYLANAEKEAYLTARQEGYEMNRDKVKVARRQYRDQGNYIEDILK